ncbi:hypothetical protein SOV_22670 [Sporomusa ovata DSM 2662]|uniref:Uncharacterized protein n=1 Tax=Sporomusa ovata TaxID=2378 RepID=A0A0U1L496_9FIRM|nr:DUF2786 domain-containing protein [Sporomusa ovata]EQB25583.1 hypothetical protein DUF2786 [Sporomusa ovata DSM 2662]CQR74139.1 hypothetical protein SpAn4DRAFT_0601 [Sporomusa ovata]
MDADQEKVIDKVRKLFNLSKSNFNGEADAALLKAQQLLMENDLTMDDVTEPIPKPAVKDITIEFASTPWWYKYLITILAENFRCEVLEEKLSRTRRRNFILISRETDIEVAKAVFQHAVVIVKHNSKRFRELGTTHENTYIKGFLEGLMVKFKEQVKKNQWGLILIKDTEVVVAKEKFNPVKARKAQAPKVTNDYEAYIHGYVDGNKLDHKQKQIEAGA